MEVTRSTFLEKLPEIKEAVDSATFLAFDCELTGLHTGQEINAFDTQQQYFEKVRRSSKDFLVVQFGLCAFRYDAETNSFKHKAYNFYIFPRHINRMVPDHRFLCQASSIDFLVQHGFDFNKLFNEGISYLNDRNECKYREALEESRQARTKQLVSPQNHNIISVPDEDKPFIDKVFDEIENFIRSDKEEHILPRCNAFLRRLIYQTATGKLEGRARLETRQIDKTKDRVLVVTRPKSANDRSKDEEAKVQEETKSLHEAIGFSALMQHISNSRKLIVGHNMMLDVLHSVDKFLTPLPDDYKSFKECVHCLLPNIIDTKYMASTALFKDEIQSTVLSHLVSTVTSEPFSVPKLESEDDTNGYSINDPKEHEAGYDAYITGVSFLSMWNYVGKANDEQNPYENLDLLKPYLNRLFLMRIQDIPYIQLDGPDTVPRRDHVFHLTFPKEWKLNDIVQLFSPFGNVYISWIDETSAYVALHKRDQANIVLTTLSQSDRYHIMTYTRRQAVLNGTLKLVKGKPVQENIAQSQKKRKASNSEERTTFKRKSFPVETKEASVEPIDATVPCLVRPRKRTISKTFEENSSWE